MDEKSFRYLLECASWLKAVNAYLQYELEISPMTAEADGVRNALVTLESNLNAMVADLAAHKGIVDNAAKATADAEANAAALSDAMAKIDELNSLIVSARNGV